jgi:hypothetical protein
LVVEVSWNSGKSKFSVKEDPKDVIVESVIFITAWKAMERKACQGDEEGREGDSNIGRGLFKCSLSLELFVCFVKFAREPFEGGS